MDAYVKDSDFAFTGTEFVEPKSTVVSPEHYERWPVEPISFIMENGLDFATGNVIKYVIRAPYKNGVEDLKKAKRYIEFLINQAEGREIIHDG